MTSRSHSCLACEGVVRYRQREDRERRKGDAAASNAPLALLAGLLTAILYGALSGQEQVPRWCSWLSRGSHIRQSEPSCALTSQVESGCTEIRPRALCACNPEVSSSILLRGTPLLPLSPCAVRRPFGAAEQARYGRFVAGRPSRPFASRFVAIRAQPAGRQGLHSLLSVLRLYEVESSRRSRARTGR